MKRHVLGDWNPPYASLGLEGKKKKINKKSTVVHGIEPRGKSGKVVSQYRQKFTLLVCHQFLRRPEGRIAAFVLWHKTDLPLLSCVFSASFSPSGSHAFPIGTFRMVAIRPSSKGWCV